MVELNFEVYELTNQLDAIPSVSGLYMIQDKTDEIVYVGMSRNLKQRLRSHKNKKWFDFGGYAAQICPLPQEQCAKAEKYLIAAHKPKLNKTH